MSWKTTIVEKPKIFNFKNKDNLYLLFLDEGTLIPVKQIIKDDGSINTIRDSIEFKVKNNKDQKEGLFYANAVSLKIALRDAIKNLTGSVLHIKHIIAEVETDNTYEVKVIQKAKQ